MKEQVHTWKNTKGMTIELHTKYVTESKTTTDWGVELTKKENFVTILKFVVDGKNIPQAHYITRTEINGVKVLDCGAMEWDGQKVRMAVALPKDVEMAVWGEYDAIEAAKKAARKKIREKEAQELKKKIANGYCTKCHSYCWGDCQANA